MHLTVWKIKDFSVSLILREKSFSTLQTSKTAFGQEIDFYSRKILALRISTLWKLPFLPFRVNFTRNGGEKKGCGFVQTFFVKKILKNYVDFTKFISIFFHIEFDFNRENLI